MLTRKLQEGQIVRSKAGHDRGTFYVILSWTERDVFVADGIKHTLEQPKRKKDARIPWRAAYLFSYSVVVKYVSR